jgi:hypothetical protein
MNSVRTMTDETKDSGVNVRMGFENVKLLLDEPRGAGDEIERRATEVGPVLEEILHSHWDCWKLDD